jgi:hypothetical protein
MRTLVTSWFLAVALMANAEAYSDTVELARADLAKRLQVPLERVVVIAQREKTWPDSSLGCPIPGMRYTQALVDGSQLILQVDKKHYHYHAGGARSYFFCATPADKGALTPSSIGPQ